MNRFINKFFGKAVSDDERLFNLAAFMSAGFSFLFVMVGCLFKFENSYLIVFGSITVVSTVLFFAEQKFHKRIINTHILITYCNFLAFPFLMAHTRKNLLEIPIYFIIGLIFSLILLSGIQRIVFFLGQLLMDVASVYYCFVVCFDESSILGATSTNEYMRVVLAVIDVFVICGIIVVYRNRLLSEAILENIEATKKAEEISYAKDMFLVNVSHEIRTPLNAIMGNTDMLLDSDCGNQIKEMASNISNAGHALLSITTDLLDFSKMDIAQINRIDEAEYDLTKLLNGIINQISVNMADKNVDLFVDINPLLPRKLLGDEAKIRQIIINMLSNAVKYTQNGNIVLTVDFEKTDDKTIKLYADVTDTGIGIPPEALENFFLPIGRMGDEDETATEGNGVGLSLSWQFANAMGGTLAAKSKITGGSSITLEIPQKINPDATDVCVGTVKNKTKTICFYNSSLRECDDFKKNLERMQLEYCQCYKLADFSEKCIESSYDYYFVDAVSYENIKRELVDNHINWKKLVLICDGNYSYSSEPFESVLIKPVSSMAIAALLNKVKDSTIRSQKYEGTFSIPGATILVIDDNLVNLEVASALLGKYYPRVIKATSGKEGLIALANEHVDLVYLDYMMPEMDGIDTLKAIRKLEDGRFISLPVVCLTANAVSGARELFMKEGFDDYLSKPIVPDKLEKTIIAHLPSNMIKYKL